MTSDDARRAGSVGLASPGERTVRRRPLTRAEVIVSGAWGVLWIACVVWAVIVVPATATSESPTTPVLVSGVLLLSLTVLGIPVTSGWLAARRRWGTVLVFAGGVTAGALAWYVVAMLAVPVPDSQSDTQDIATGAGLVVLAVPTAAVVALLTSIGAGAGALVQRARLAPVVSDESS